MGLRHVVVVGLLAAALAACGGESEDAADEPSKASEPEPETFQDKAVAYAREQIAAAKESDEAGVSANEDLARTFHAEYVVHVDASRAVEIEVAGVFQPVTSVEDAPAGKSEVETIAAGIVRATNTTEGRAVEDFEHTLTLQLAGPVLCGKQPTCTHELAEISAVSLEPGETNDDIALGDVKFKWVGSGEVAEEDARAAAESIAAGVLVADKTTVFGGDYLDANDDVCPGNRVVFWSEDRAAVTC